jgi:hypothetical protein
LFAFFVGCASQLNSQHERPLTTHAVLASALTSPSHPGRTVESLAGKSCWLGFEPEANTSLLTSMGSNPCASLVPAQPAMVVALTSMALAPKLGRGRGGLPARNPNLEGEEAEDEFAPRVAAYGEAALAVLVLVKALAGPEIEPAVAAWAGAVHGGVQAAKPRGVGAGPVAFVEEVARFGQAERAHAGIGTFFRHPKHGAARQGPLYVVQGSAGGKGRLPTGHGRQTTTGQAARGPAK